MDLIYACDFGYTVTLMAKIKLKINGMHCRSCSALIKDVLEDEKGISSADVVLESGTASVEYDESKVNLEQIKKMIESEGYKVE